MEAMSRICGASFYLSALISHTTYTQYISCKKERTCECIDSDYFTAFPLDINIFPSVDVALCPHFSIMVVLFLKNRGRRPKKTPQHDSVPQKGIKVPFQWMREAFTTAGGNLSMGLCISRTVGCVFEGHAYVCVWAHLSEFSVFSM